MTRLSTQPLSAEELDELRDMERLFGENGWFRLEKAWQERATAIRANALSTVKDMNDVWRQRGQLDIFDALIRMREEFQADKAAREEPPNGGDDDYE